MLRVWEQHLGGFRGAENYLNSLEVYVLIGNRATTRVKVHTKKGRDGVYSYGVSAE